MQWVSPQSPTSQATCCPFLQVDSTAGPSNPFLQKMRETYLQEHRALNRRLCEQGDHQLSTAARRDQVRRQRSNCHRRRRSRREKFVKKHLRRGPKAKQALECTSGAKKTCLASSPPTTTATTRRQTAPMTAPARSHLHLMRVSLRPRRRDWTGTLRHTRQISERVS